MFTRYTISSEHEIISIWWREQQDYLAPILELLAAKRYIKTGHLQDGISAVEKRFQQFEAAEYPPQVEGLRKDILKIFGNLLQSLIYQRQNNDFQGKVRFDIARADMDSLRFRLVQIGIYE